MSVRMAAEGRPSPAFARVAAEGRPSPAFARVAAEGRQGPASVSVIVPVFNEASTIDALQDQFDRIDFAGSR